MQNSGIMRVCCCAFILSTISLCHSRERLLPPPAGLLSQCHSVSEMVCKQSIPKKKKKKKPVVALVSIRCGLECLCTGIEHVYEQWSPLYLSQLHLLWRAMFWLMVQYYNHALFRRKSLPSLQLHFVPQHHREMTSSVNKL